MEREEELRRLPDRPPRHCPTCGSRVAEGATTCLMCGAALEEETEGAATPAPPRTPRLTRRQLGMLGALTLILLAGAIFLGLNLSSAQELPTPTPTLTLTPTSSPTPTPIPPQLYTVQAGDTLETIASAFGMTVDELMTFNNLTSELIREGDSLRIPPPTPTPGPTPTLDPSQPTLTLAPFIPYTVQQGDTLSTIAEEFDITMNDIWVANPEMEPGVTVIRAEQVLMIPQFTPTPEVTPEVVVGGTPEPQISYPPPTLLYPPDEATFTGLETAIVLQWASVGILPEDSYYRVTVTLHDSDEVEESTLTRATAWHLPEELLPTATTEIHRFTWRVELVRRSGSGTDETYTLLGSSSASRSLYWQAEE